MNSRTRQLLKYLQKNERVSLEVLKEKFSVSLRTLRNDVHAADDFLREHSLGNAEIVANELKYFISDKKLLEKKLNNFSIYNYKLSKFERVLVSAIMLMESNSYTSIQSICEKLLISRTTFLSDLKELKKYVTKYNLEIQSKTNKGLKLVGEERDIRFFLIDYFTNYEGEKLSKEILFKNNCKVFDIDFSELKVEFRKFFDKELSVKFIEYLKISTYRNLSGKFLYFVECKDNTLLFNLKKILDKDEYAYLSLTDNDLINFINFYGKDEQNSNSQNATKLQIITMEFIEKISSSINIDLTVDYVFYNNLANHIMGMNKNVISDVSEHFFLEELINRNKQVNKIIDEHIEILEKAINRKVSKNERSYILIHIYAALERKKKKNLSLKVALLTDYRKGTVLFLESQLKNNFSFDLTVFNSLEEIDLEKFDLHLTTVAGISDFIKISSVMTDEEFITISKNIDIVIKEKEKNDFSLEKDIAYRLYDLVVDEIDKIVPNQKLLKDNIKKVIMNHAQSDTKNRQLNLTGFLEKSRIKTGVSAKNWKEAVYESGKILLESNSIKPEYIDEVCNNLIENDFYVVISEGFAFPHANISKYVNETAMSLVKLEEPIYFKGEDEILAEDDIRVKPVNYVCMLSPEDNKKHLRAFFNLTNLLKKEEFKRELNNAITIEEIYAIIRDFEYLLELERGEEDV